MEEIIFISKGFLIGRPVKILDGKILISLENKTNVIIDTLRPVRINVVDRSKLFFIDYNLAIRKEKLSIILHKIERLD